MATTERWGHRPFREHARNMSGTCPEHVRNMSGTCPEHVQNMSGTCPEHVRGYPSHPLPSRPDLRSRARRNREPPSHIATPSGAQSRAGRPWVGPPKHVQGLPVPCITAPENAPSIVLPAGRSTNKETDPFPKYHELRCKIIGGNGTDGKASAESGRWREESVSPLPVQAFVWEPPSRSSVFWGRGVLLQWPLGYAV